MILETLFWSASNFYFINSFKTNLSDIVKEPSLDLIA